MNDENALAAAALASPGEYTLTAALADWYEEHGRERLAACLRTFGLVKSKKIGDGGDGYGDGYGDGGDGGYGDGGDGDGGGYGGGYGGYGDGYGGGYGDGGDDGGYGDGGYGGKFSTLLEIADMRDGLYILTTAGGYSPYVLIGWAKVNGLEIALHGARVIRRFGGSAALAGLAANGPIPQTQLLEPSEVEYLFRANLGRVIPANPKKWKKECPQPAGWDGGE